MKTQLVKICDSKLLSSMFLLKYKFVSIKFKIFSGLWSEVIHDHMLVSADFGKLFILQLCDYLIVLSELNLNIDVCIY